MVIVPCSSFNWLYCLVHCLVVPMLSALWLAKRVDEALGHVDYLQVRSDHVRSRTNAVADSVFDYITISVYEYRLLCEASLVIRVPFRRQPMQDSR